MIATENFLPEILQGNLHWLQYNYARSELARITIKDKTHYLQSRPTAEIAILVCRSQGDSEPSWLEFMILLKSKSLSWSRTGLYSQQSLFYNIMDTRAAKMQGPNCIGCSTVSCLGPHCWGTPLIQPACRVFSWSLVHSVVQKLLEVPIVRVHIFVV